MLLYLGSFYTMVTKHNSVLSASLIGHSASADLHRSPIALLFQV